MLKENLKKYILHELDSRKGLNLNQITVGIEHEFFLLNSQGLPTSIDESQFFLKKLAESTGWKETLSDGKSKVIKLSKEHIINHHPRYSQIKYDHEPHLIEIAFAYFENLVMLENEVRTILDHVYRVAHKLGFKLTSSVNIEGSDLRVSPDGFEWIQLRRFRKESALYHKREISKSLENYAAVIAATQVHIGDGNINLFTDSMFVNNLYFYEPYIQGFANLNINPSKRWKPYLEVYKGYPLVGYPEVSFWSLDYWLDSLLVSPVFLPNHKSNPFSIFKDIPEADLNVGKLFKSIRDLQIVRPKLYNTLEFRADPSQASIEGVMALAALRLGIYLHVRFESKSLRNLKESHQIWWKNALSEKLDLNLEVLSIAEKMLSIYQPESVQYLVYYK